LRHCWFGQHPVVALTAASLDRVWFVPSRSALFAEFQNRCVVFVVSGIFVIFAIFAVSVVGVVAVNILR
jgi:hypothetical protein